nr:uncharacterized mitochondrial protein AtMg00810-like [Tanacetum cinerariifolium]
MRNEEIASWDLGQMHMGRSGLGVGTVPVSLGVQEIAGAEGYLEGTLSLGLWYSKCSGLDLKGYSDSNYAGCNMDKKNTLGACQFLRGKLVCWSDKKQQSVAMSSAKAKYVAAAGYCANIL